MIRVVFPVVDAELAEPDHFIGKLRNLARAYKDLSHFLIVASIWFVKNGE